MQGCIQTENGSVRMLWAPKKMPPKMKMRKRKLLLSVKISQVNNELPCVLFKKTSYTAKNKWLKRRKT